MPDSRQINFRDAVREALFEEMHRDPDVVVMGEDVGAAGGVFKQTAGLLEAFGIERVIDTPISESAAFGAAVGAAMAGLRPVFEVMFGDFITLVMDQLVNHAAKLHYMTGGAFKVPLVLRTTVGVGGSAGPQHSQSLHAWLSHVPGLKVVIPSSPYDAKGLLKSAIRDDNPVVVFEDRLLYTARGEVPDDEWTVPLGQARVVREGADVTIVATGRMVALALRAAEEVEGEGISVEVIDPRSLVPLDAETLIASAKKTSRVLVVDGGCQQYGVTGELSARIMEGAFYYLDAPIYRIGATDTPVPFAPALEPLVIPDERRIAQAVRRALAATGVSIGHSHPEALGREPVGGKAWSGGR